MLAGFAELQAAYEASNYVASSMVEEALDTAGNYYGKITAHDSAGFVVELPGGKTVRASTGTTDKWAVGDPAMLHLVHGRYMIGGPGGVKT